MDEIKKIMDDCKKSRIKVLNPDINESGARFTVNKDGDIRFGLGGIKGFGDNIVKALIDDRTQNGPYSDIWDFAERLAGMVNKKALESLLYSGAFDSFGYSRKQYTMPTASGDTFLDALVRYADLYNRDKMNASGSLFFGMAESKPQRPEMPEERPADDDGGMEMLKREKDLVGMYLSAHPLDKYAYEVENFTNCKLADIPDMVAKCDK